MECIWKNCLILHFRETESPHLPFPQINSTIQFDSFTQSTIVISANVTEGLTHITLSSSKQIVMYANAEKIEFVTSAENDSIFARHDVLKPGLPFTAYVRYLLFHLSHVYLEIYLHCSKMSKSNIWVWCQNFR